MLGCIQPMSSPMMNRMFGLLLLGLRLDRRPGQIDRCRKRHQAHCDSSSSIHCRTPPQIDFHTTCVHSRGASRTNPGHPPVRNSHDAIMTKAEKAWDRPEAAAWSPRHCARRAPMPRPPELEGRPPCPDISEERAPLAGVEPTSPPAFPAAPSGGYLTTRTIAPPSKRTLGPWRILCDEAPIG